MQQGGGREMLTIRKAGSDPASLTCQGGKKEFPEQL